MGTDCGGDAADRISTGKGALFSELAGAMGTDCETGSGMGEVCWISWICSTAVGDAAAKTSTGEGAISSEVTGTVGTDCETGSEMSEDC